jgi:hypothetical protein
MKKKTLVVHPVGMGEISSLLANLQHSVSILRSAWAFLAKTRSWQCLVEPLLGFCSPFIWERRKHCN